MPPREDIDPSKVVDLSNVDDGTVIRRDDDRLDELSRGLAAVTDGTEVRFFDLDLGPAKPGLKCWRCPVDLMLDDAVMGLSDDAAMVQVFNLKMISMMANFHVVWACVLPEKTF